MSGMDNNMIPAMRSELCRCGAGLAAARCNKQSGVGRGGFRLWGSLLPTVEQFTVTYGMYTPYIP